MTYQVLARKWRPRNFKDMVGQEHILRMLANALDQKRIHHAYLLTGTRGVGKTTLGRILAKALNCETGITSNPCGTCAPCQAIDAGQFLDLYEVDAASRTKVEDTRELLENVLYPPSQGRYKIYLIDEVHMLSNHSFNALLKTLEEPPEHVKFILATTDPKKLPVTILSRCLQFHLKRIMPEQIAQHLKQICENENITYDLSALTHLAKAADGSMRDALSLLDQAIAYGHGAVNEKDVFSMLGSMAQDDLLPLLTALADKDGNTLFKCIKEIASRAPDFHQVLEELINLFHQMAITQIVQENAAENAMVASFAKRFSAEDVQLYYQIALLGRRDLSFAPTPQQGFEMTMIRMFAFKPELNLTKTNTVIPKAETKKPPVIQVTPELEVRPQLSEWREILPKLELTGMAYALAANCQLVKLEGNKVELALAENHLPMLNQKLKERIADALTRYLKQNIQLEINISTEVLITPTKQQEHEEKEQLANAKEIMMKDPQVKQLIDMYDATVEVSLISS